MSNPASIQNDLDDIQTQIYIISGVVGGFNFLLIIAVIIIAVKLARLKKMLKVVSSGAVVSGDLSKRGYSAYTGGKPENSTPIQSVAPPHPQPQQSFSPPPPPPRAVPQAGFSYDNNAYYDQQQRPHNPLDMGVQVLPKNPPPPRGGQQTDGFY